MTTTSPPQVGIRQDPAFRQLWRAQGFSLVGSEAYDFTLLLLTTAAYGAVLSIGWLGAALTAGALLLGPVFATVQDRMPRRRGDIMRAADLARAGLTLPACLVLAFDVGPAVTIYGIVVASTVLDVVFQSTLRASLPRLVGDGEGDGGGDPAALLSQANASLISQWSIVQVAIPPLFALVLTVVDPWAVVLFNGVTFLASGLILRGYAARVEATYGDQGDGSRVHEPLPSDRSSPAFGFWSNAVDGARIVLRDRCVAHLLGAYAVANALTFAVLLSVPTLLQDGGSGNLLVGICLAGLSLGSFAGARWGGRVRGVTAQMTVVVADPFVRALALVCIAVAGDRAVVVAPLFVLGACIGLSNVVRLSFVQGRFADSAMGRVMSAYAVANQLLLPVAALGWTLASRWAGVEGSYAVLGGVSLLSALVLISARSVRDTWRTTTGGARAVA